MYRSWYETSIAGTIPCRTENMPFQGMMPGGQLNWQSLPLFSKLA